MSKAIIALAIVAVASASASGYLWRQLASERAQTASLQARIAELEKAPIPLPAPIAAAEAPPPPPAEPALAAKSGAAKPTGAQAALVQTAPAMFSVNGVGRPGTVDPDMRRRMMEAHEQQLRMLKDPEYRELMRSQQKLGMMQMYGDLEPLLGLTKEESDRLLDVLAEQSLRGMEQRPMFSAMDGTQPGEADMRERQRVFEEQRRKNEAEIAGVLGSRYDDWKEYQNNSWSRSQVMRLRQTLSSGSEPLRQDQIKPLVEAIAREQQQALAPMRFNSPGRPDPQSQLRMSEEWLERTAQSHERIRTAVSGLLTPSQFEQLQRQQEQELKMQELSVKQQRARADAIARGELPPDPVMGTSNTVMSLSN